MKIKENFHLRKIAGTWAVLPTGDATLDFNGILTLNESGYMLWNLLEKGCTREDMAKALTEEYEVSLDEALADCDAFIEKLQQAKCIDL